MRGYSISVEQNNIGTSWNAYGLLGNNGTGWRQVVHGGTLSTVGTWCHLCLTYNGTSLYLYRNGVQVASGTSAGTFSATAAGVPFLCGKHYAQAWYWNGAIGDLAVWSGRALSASEVADWYGSSLAGHASILSSVSGRARLIGSRLIGSSLIC
jgi:hypothetical protein